MSNIFILYTGGTIGMTPSDPTDLNSPLAPANLDDLALYMPAIRPDGFFASKSINLTYKSLSPLLDSSEFTPHDWVKMGREISENYSDYDGFVIIHGTDTMAYTASALSFMFSGLQKPVIVTGSQLPISNPRTDAVSNLTNAIYLAAAKSFNLPVINEVCICFNDDLLRGNRATKFSTNDLEGFQSPNYPTLANLEERIHIKTQYLSKHESSNFSLSDKFDNNILVLPLFPGMNADHLKPVVEGQKIKGLVLRSFGAGNAPSDSKLLDILKLAKEKEIVVLNITQCYEGTVSNGKYQAAKGLESCGVVSGADLTPEAAITKLMWCLANFDFDQCIQMIQTPLKGEMNL
jgi:L-asparaginase